MSTKKTSYPPIHIGTSFLLVIFIILCMIIFSVLSLSSALQDYQASLEHAARTTAYYEACNQAEALRAQLASEDHTEETIEYTVPIDEDELLRVVLTLDEHNEYQITTWVQESVREWHSDQTLPVLGSE